MTANKWAGLPSASTSDRMPDIAHILVPLAQLSESRQEQGMSTDVTQSDPGRLRPLLEQALAVADRCEPIVAIHIATAIAVLDQQAALSGQPDEC
jgi:hypothetical protein